VDSTVIQGCIHHTPIHAHVLRSRPSLSVLCCAHRQHRDHGYDVADGAYGATINLRAACSFTAELSLPRPRGWHGSGGVVRDIVLLLCH